MANERKRGRIAFVGLGLHDEEGVSLAGMREIEQAEVVFAEAYTSTLSEGSLARLSMRSGKKIELLDRATVEDGKRIIETCIGRRVALLVPGDPMTATTHVDLRLRAAMAGLETVVIHGSSVLTAVPGLLGLQHYKFGRTTSLPFPQEGYAPTSPYDVIAENLSRGLHTTVLLDIDADNRRCMTANEGLHLLLDMERRVARGIITDNMTVCVVARAGAPDTVVRAGPLKELLSENFGPPPHAIVVPGTLHFMEKEALDIFGKGGSREEPSITVG